MIVDRYNGYSVNRVRESNYKVKEAREEFQIVDESTGRIAFTYTGYYNPKRIVKTGDKEAVISKLMEPVLKAIRIKIDTGELSDGFLHSEAAGHALGHPQPAPESGMPQTPPEAKS